MGLSLSDLTSGVGKVVDFFGATQRSRGAQEALEAQQRQAIQQGGGGGMSTTTMLLIGGVALTGLLAIYALRK